MLIGNHYTYRELTIFKTYYIIILVNSKVFNYLLFLLDIPNLQNKTIVKKTFFFIVIISNKASTAHNIIFFFSSWITKS